MSRIYSPELKQKAYKEVLDSITLMIEGETDLIAIMATICCELKQAFCYFDWVGFYRNVGNDVLKVGPYQGGHGCLNITFDRGVCGKAARTRQTQIVDDVNLLPYHIACSSSTISEIVVPWIINNELFAVLDIDSDDKDAFDKTDQHYLQKMLSNIKI
ncbi:GAF domain-containing protein [Cysteiniphilum sp. QT6929]|uniref:GAF domain-containing protein n=1 Tax=Cysteiniphilum sp. QT6929 TaxID=2975055 RepID=UPI0024B33AB2|nr:GAF domain-containing protein [Cysteiniphilum sp. QT6929]WHN65040.1 GAF domain-containing protein [Cysteiniphilum sp. QT6929]